MLINNIKGKQKKKDKSLHIKPAITWPTLKLAIKRIDRVRGWIIKLKTSTKERTKKAPLGKK